jgi:hypothetical protein
VHYFYPLDRFEVDVSEIMVVLFYDLGPFPETTTTLAGEDVDSACAAGSTIAGAGADKLPSGTAGRAEDMIVGSGLLQLSVMFV